MTLTPTDIFAYSAGISAFSAIVGWFANHWLSSARDKRKELDGRRLELLKFLSEWRSKIERLSPKPIDRIWVTYTEAVHKFHGLARCVGNDRNDDEDFRKLSDALGGIRYETVSTALGDQRDAIAQHIDSLRTHLEKT